MRINDTELASIIGTPLLSSNFMFVETTLRGIIRDSETLSEINIRAGREYLSLLEEGRPRAAEIFDNLAFWAFFEADRVPTVSR